MSHRHSFLTRLITVIAIAAAMPGYAPTPSFAQSTPPNSPPADPFSDPLFAEMIGQMRQGMNQLKQSGADPEQLFQQLILGGLKDGNLDRSALQQQMLDLGLLSPDLVDRLNASRKTRFIQSIRTQLACSDDEWGVLEPRIDSVIAAQIDVNIADKKGLAADLGANAASTMAKAQHALQAAVADPHAGDQQLANLLTQWRIEHERAKAKLKAARQDLTDVLTIRQEAVLCTSGLL